MGRMKDQFNPEHAAMALYSAELNESHRLLDTVGISQSGYEEQLTISQRVAMAVELINQLRAAIAARSPFVR